MFHQCRHTCQARWYSKMLNQVLLPIDLKGASPPLLSECIRCARSAKIIDVKDVLLHMLHLDAMDSMCTNTEVIKV